MNLEQRLSYLEKLVAELEYKKQLPAAEDVEKIMKLMNVHGFTELNFGMLRLSKPWIPSGASLVGPEPLK